MLISKHSNGFNKLIYEIDTTSSDIAARTAISKFILIMLSTFT